MYNKSNEGYERGESGRDDLSQYVGLAELSSGAQAIQERLSAITKDRNAGAEITRFGAHLRRKYPDWKQYELYHALSGSSRPNDCPNYDFPGVDSIEELTKYLETKYGQSQAA